MLTTRPLSPHLGVEVLGLKGNAPTPAQADEMRRLFTAHHLLLIRDMRLDERESVALAEVIGPVSKVGDTMKGDRKFTLISNAHQDGRLPDGELLFHADHMFYPNPLRAISLYAMMVPSSGGETRFINMAAAYADLPAELKDEIAGKHALHVYNYGANSGNQAPTRDMIGPDTKTATHPIVYRHPETGKSVLFVSRLFCVDVVGMPPDEGDQLLEKLYRHIESRSDDYAHRWQAGDFLIWDNRILQHARNDFPSNEKRAMRRTPIGDREAVTA